MLSRRESRIALGAVAAMVAVAIAGAGYEYHHEQRDQRKHAEAITGGDPTRGRALFAAYGCGGCHSLSGVPQAHGQIGPPLDTIGERAMIAGKLQNTPQNLENWIVDPQAVTAGTAMPRLGVSPAQARDIAAFLYTR